MSLIDRAKNIIVTPKTEWDVIAAEATPAGALITGYVLPLAAVSALALFIGTSFVGTTMPMMGTVRLPVTWGVAMLVYHIVMAVVAVFILSLVIDALAPTFGATKDRAQALKLAVYSYTPAWIAGVFMIIPALGILVFLAGLYGIYLLYLGLPRLMRNPPDKSAGYTALVVVCAIVIGIVISIIATTIGNMAMTGTAAMGGRMGAAIMHDRDSPAAKLDDFAKKMENASKGVDPVQIDQLKPLVPATFAGLPRTNDSAERSGVPGLMTTKAEATYSDPQGGKNAQLEITDTGGAAGFMALAGWINVQGEREANGRTERTRKEGNRLTHEEFDSKANESKYTVVVGERFVVSAEGNGVDLSTLKSAVASIDLGKLEALK